MAKDSVSLDKLLECGKREFVDNGFKNASLRSIAAAAGLTTGAIYGCFKNKDVYTRGYLKTPCALLVASFPPFRRRAVAASYASFRLLDLAESPPQSGPQWVFRHALYDR